MLKMSLCFAAGYLFYHLLLRRITHYSWNRWYLLLCSVLSFVIPAININLFVAPQQLSNVFFIHALPAIDALTPSVNKAAPAAQWWDATTVMQFLFLSGVCILLLRLAVQFISLKVIQAKAKLISNGEVRIFHLDAWIAPFSFNNNIYFNKDMYSQQELEEVIRHELVHVNQKHTIDALVAELLCIVNWYNPFAWMIKRAIKENLEFIADDKVLQQGISRQGYQYLLLKVTGNIPCGITNTLNFSSFKNRIAMMNKSKTSRLHLLKFTFIIPLACVLLVAFRPGPGKKAPVIVNKAIEGSSETFTLGTLTYSISDPMVETIVKKDQGNSFLKPGNVLSLSSIQSEKFRLAGLLNKNGYDTGGEHAIYFMVDTFSTNKSFSIQVTINVPLKKGTVKTGNNTLPKSPVLGHEENKARYIEQGISAVTGVTRQLNVSSESLPAGDLSSSAI